MNRSSGVLMHVSSLYGDYSVGSFGKEALEFIDFLSEGGFSYWQTERFEREHCRPCHPERSRTAKQHRA